MTAPPLGTFIRPVPALLYCYQVIKVIPEDAEGPECLFCKRFGYDPETQRPVQGQFFSADLGVALSIMNGS